MKSSRTIQYLLSHSPRRSLQRAITEAQSCASRWYSRHYDNSRPAFAIQSPAPSQPLRSHLTRLSEASLREVRETIAALSDYYLSHRFDLLGSGWVRVVHGMKIAGLEGHIFDPGPAVASDTDGHWLVGRINKSNLAESRRLWSLIQPGYTPIDWQLDFKSGYRWSELHWYREIRWGHVEGADVKVPWELGRMQHLPQLAVAYAVAETGLSGMHSRSTYANEFRNQVLDFMATNPPRFGVNWASSMDVGIRVSNWLVAYDLLRAHGHHFDDAFEQVFARSIREHANHIASNLEWTDGLRANHYFANVAGLLFCSAYLPQDPQVNSWAAFATQEFIEEVRFQFHEEGSNFEASTCYHGLSAQIVTYAAALVMGLEGLAAFDSYDYRLQPRLQSAPVPTYPTLAAGGQSRLPPWFGERLSQMAAFIDAATKPDGRIIQVGDNDSGRFMKLVPPMIRRTVSEVKERYKNLNEYAELEENAYWDEQHLVYRNVTEALECLIESDARPGSGIETQVVRMLSRTRRLTVTRHDTSLGAIGAESDLQQMLSQSETRPDAERQVTSITADGPSLLDGMSLQMFPQFGLYIMRSNRLFLSVRCGPVGQSGIGGHAHNDQLSVDLNIDGQDRIVDPGSYLYTPLPRFRNAYRSVKAHFAPRVAGKEPARLDLGLFRLADRAQAQCLYFGHHGFAGTHIGYEAPVFRLVQVFPNEVRFTDYADGVMLERLAAPDDRAPSLSVGYGRRYTY